MFYTPLVAGGKCILIFICVISFFVVNFLCQVAYHSRIFENKIHFICAFHYSVILFSFYL